MAVSGPRVHIWTDGSFDHNTNQGAWAAIVQAPRAGKKKSILSGSRVGRCSTEFELQAVVEGLKFLKEPCRVVLTTDCRYVKDSIRYLPAWRKNGWKKRNQPIPESELWKELDQLLQYHDEVVWKWVPGHDAKIQNSMNKLADKVAKNTRKRCSPGAAAA